MSRLQNKHVVIYMVGKDSPLRIPEGEYGVAEFYAETNDEVVRQFAESIHGSSKLIAVIYGISAYNVSLTGTGASHETTTP